METVFLNGGRSFIGGHVCRALIKRGYQVILHSATSSQFKNLADVLPHPQVSVATCPYDQTDQMKELLARAQYSIFSAVPPGLQTLGQKKRKELDFINLKHILDLLATSPIKKSVFISTCSTIGRVPEGLADETCFPAKNQGWSAIAFKMRLENLVMDYCRQGLPITIVNPTMLVGEYDTKPSTGEVFRFIDQASFVIFKGIKINFIDAADAALGTVLALEKGRVGERYILGGENVLFEDICARIRQCGKKPLPQFAMPYAGIVTVAFISELINLVLRQNKPMVPLLGVELNVHGNQFLTYEKARKELGFVPGDSWAAVDRAYQWYQSHGLLKK